MSIWNKVLIGLILVASVAFLYLAARALKTHRAWGEEIARLEQLLEEQQTSQEGSPSGPPGLIEQVSQLDLELRKQLLNRGRVWGGAAIVASEDSALYDRLVKQGRPWRGCTAEQVSAPTGEVTVRMGSADHGIKAQTVLFAFDEAPRQQGGGYLGQFTVAGVDPNDPTKLQLQPRVQVTDVGLRDKELKRLAAAANRPWILYEVMPVDTHQAFDGLSQQQLEQLLPKPSVQEYATDGQMTTAEDVKTQGLRGAVLAVDAEGNTIYVDEGTGEVVHVESVDGGERIAFVDADGRVAKGPVMPRELQTGRGKYVRQLRDYGGLFRDLYLQFAKRADDLQLATRERDDLQAAGEDAKRQIQYRQTERDGLDADKKRLGSQVDLVVKHLEALGERLAAITGAIDETNQANRAIAGKIAAIQREAAEKIDEQTRRVAQAGPPE